MAVRMTGLGRCAVCVLVAAGTLATSGVLATVPDPADHSMRKFLSQEDVLHPYRATRRLEAENGDRKGWLEVATEYSRPGGFRYETIAEGGSSYIRNKILRAVLEGERDAVTQDDAARSALVPTNYRFEPHGIDSDGLANILVSPRRKESILVAGTLFLKPTGGDLVRLEGRLAKSPSFWVKNVDITRSYARIDGATVPVVLHSNAEIRLLGPATFHMTYSYSEIDGHPVATR
jgi:hypothetical protein